MLLTQRAIDAFTPSVWQAIRDMHAYGFRFALDGIEHMHTDFAALAVAGFRFIRLPSHVVFDGFTAPDRFVAADEIYQRATLAGLRSSPPVSRMRKRRSACSRSVSTSDGARCSAFRAR